MKCFYHSADLDGQCSGAIVKMKYPECEMIGINYGDKFPWETIGQGEKVFMVDFGLQPYPEMRKLDIVADPLIWIDHHKSAIEENEEWLKSGNDSILGIQQIGKGACELVWRYLWQDSENRTIPTFVKLLADYDVWDHSDPRTLSFQYGMRQYDTNPENQDFWRKFFDVERVQQIVEQGSIILKYEISQNEKYVQSSAFETELDGLKCIAVNKMFTSSQLFDSIWDPEKYDAMLTFGFRNGQWAVSLYSDKDNVDVSVIAKNRGGGGHKGAAGFQCKSLPFQLRS